MPGTGGTAAPLLAVLRGRCPRCGQGALFTGLLTVRPACPVCGLDLSRYEAGDGPAVAGIFIVGAAAVIAALVVDARYRPPLWVHAITWPLLILGLSVLVMRWAKAALVVVQYRNGLVDPGA